MKKFELTLIQKKENENAVAASYKELAILSVRYVDPKEPITDLEVMGDKIKLLNKIKETPAGGIVELESSEIRILNKSVQSFPWGVVDEDLYNFRVAVKNLEEKK